MTAPDAELERYWAALLAADEAEALAVALELAERRPVAEVLDRLVVAAQRRVGEHWAADRMEVPREHAATALNDAVVRALGRTVAEPTGPLVLVACVEREWHSLSTRVLTQVLRSWGVRAVDLGASASPTVLISHIVDRGPRAVLLSASLSSSLVRARRVVEAVRGTGTPVVVGGRAFDAARARAIGATAYAAGPGEVVEAIGTLPRHVGHALPLRHAGATEARGLHTSDERVAADVGAVLAERLGVGATDVPPDHWWGVLTGFLPHLVDCLAGALLVEDPTVLEEAIDWLTRVLAVRGAPGDAVDHVRHALAERLVEHPEATALLARLTDRPPA